MLLFTEAAVLGIGFTHTYTTPSKTGEKIRPKSNTVLLNVISQHLDKLNSTNAVMHNKLGQKVIKRAEYLHF
jgi:hypothetical protein